MTNSLNTQAYKVTEPTIHALIPGMVHTKHDFHMNPALKALISPKLKGKCHFI